MQIKSFNIILILLKCVVNSDGFLLHGSAGPLTARLGGAVLLPCFVDTPLPLEELEVDWRRTDSDIIVHLFQDGQSRPESQGDAYRDRAHFFSQEIPKGNFSLLLEGVRTADAGVYKCVVYTEQEQRETRLEIQEAGTGRQEQRRQRKRRVRNPEGGADDAASEGRSEAGTRHNSGSTYGT
ncbi:butyrophilin subfamily 2 member A1-like isoform X1 [Paramormyrops kingsleyae]|uniref:butyrophilin subfamily 2 member A1-like isoform X1 n=1 Tax=Paramormyrops kingsleyae TaxID=1676925 RepID=UPI003B9731A9